MLDGKHYCRSFAVCIGGIVVIGSQNKLPEIDAHLDDFYGTIASDQI